MLPTRKKPALHGDKGETTNDTGPSGLPNIPMEATNRWPLPPLQSAIPVTRLKSHATFNISNKDRWTCNTAQNEGRKRSGTMLLTPKLACVWGPKNFFKKKHRDTSLGRGTWFGVATVERGLGKEKEGGHPPPPTPHRHKKNKTKLYYTPPGKGLVFRPRIAKDTPGLTNKSQKTCA